LQKYVLLAEDFGFEHGYRYGMHLRGPYSPPLAQDYYTDLTSVAPDLRVRCRLLRCSRAREG
jgi:hypothetical protein